MTADCIGGVWGYSLELARALAPLGVEVHLATMGRNPSAEQRAEAAGIPGVTLHSSEFRLEWMDDPWADVADAGEWLLALERQLQPDIVHLNGYAHGTLPFSAPVMVVAHSCVCSWWRAVRGEDAPASWDAYRVAVRRGLGAATAVVAPTQAMLDALAEHYGFTTGGHVIANARKADAYRPMRKSPFVLTAGRVWDEGKNIGAVVRASRSVRWPVYVAGDDAAPAGAAGAGDPGVLATNVHYLGRLGEAELARWMGRAAVCALPARYEPFGLTALEAGLAGCALVLGDIPTLRQVWGDAPIFVTPGDERALAWTLEALTRDRELRERVAARCRARALEYTPERMRDAYLALYASLAPAAAVAQLEAPACA